jgi:hypothetical protein
MIYSVWNQAARQYDYYETSTVQKGANTPAPSHIRAKPLGATIDQAAWPLPAGARKVGSGESLGAFTMDQNTFAMVGLGLAAFLLWKSGYLKA